MGSWPANHGKFSLHHLPSSLQVERDHRANVTVPHSHPRHRNKLDRTTTPFLEVFIKEEGFSDDEAGVEVLAIYVLMYQQNQALRG